MDASTKKSCNGSGSGKSSSSEDEDLEKFKEAVWHMDGPKTTDGGKKDSEQKPTRRLNVSDHQHDCNELTVTPEFRAHVAKKLEHMLDSFISEKPAGAASHESSSTLENDDLGFKLFATSIQGNPRFEDAQCPVNRPVKRRQVPSSSESDSEMDIRIREAAVSANDFRRPPPTAVEGTPKKADINEATTGHSQADTESPVHKKKKNKKRKNTKREEGSVGKDFEEQIEQEESPCRKKVKKQDRLKTTSDKSVSVKSSLQSLEFCGKLKDNEQEQGSAVAKVRRKRKRKGKALDKSTEV